jgi:hypothetical protein
VPVDPEPLKVWSALSSTKRDLLFGLALSEMADLIHDRKSRQAMKTKGVNLMKTAASQMRGYHRALIDADFNLALVIAGFSYEHSPLRFQPSRRSLGLRVQW